MIQERYWRGEAVGDVGSRMTEVAAPDVRLAKFPPKVELMPHHDSPAGA